jgi:nucleotide-binding universal stress UspA family protein
MKKTPPTKRSLASRKPKTAKLSRISRPPAGRVIDLVPRVLRVRRILVPVDFSKPASKAVRYAASFARQFDAKITLLHVCPVPYYPAELGGIPTVIPQNEPPADLIQDRLDAEAKRLIPEGMRRRPLIRVGAAFDEVCKAASELKIDLIIIATHGRTGLKHMVLGSTAERIVRHAPCPVLVVREAEKDFA